MARSWKFWTKGKLDMLRGYAPAFNKASSGKASERIYVDLMAGEPENVRRDTGELMEGSPAVALGADPGFTRHRFFELDPKKAADLEVLLRTSFPQKDFKICQGDCNLILKDALTELLPYRWAPTFAFLDQQGADVNWSTLDLLSRFKKKGSTKVELWLLFPAGMAHVRRLPKSGQIRSADVDRLNQHFGCPHWFPSYEVFLDGHIDGPQLREQLVTLMRWRLEKVLGYQWTLPFEVFDERNISLYHLILATDSKAGLDIMTWLYKEAMQKFPAMAAEERRRKVRVKEEGAGIMHLFDLEPPQPPESAKVKLVYEPPTRPLGLPEDEDC